MTFTACYDLSRCPPTYDVVAFLAHVELERLRRGEDAVDLRILPGPAGGFRRDSLWPRSIEERMLLRERVLVPICRLLPSAQVTVDRTREAEGWGKDEYIISLPAIMSALRGGSRPLRAPEPARGGAPLQFARPTITMTLRESDHHPLRNSRVDQWIRAAHALGERGHRVVIIRDTARAYEEIDGLVTFPEAAVSMERRAAVYAGAALNLGICNGPTWLSIFMDAPTLMMRPTTDAAGGCYDDAFYTKWGLPPGSQLPTSPPYQRLVWENDEADAIVAAVESHLQRVD